MTSAPPSSARQNLAGSLWMAASMLSFSIEDVLLKLASGDLALPVVMITFGLFGTALFALACAVRGEAILARPPWRRSMILRFWFEVFGRLFFTLSLVLSGLGSTVAILQAAPLVVSLSAAVVFRERVAAMRWAAIGVGFCGVMLILRPAAGDFSALSVLAVLGMLGLALRDLATRAVPRTVPNAVLGFYSFASVVVAGLVLALFEGAVGAAPALADLPLLFAAALAGAGGYIALTQAMRLGDVSVVSVFRYTRLVCGALFGAVLFAEDLAPLDLLGGGLIIAAGVIPLCRARAPRRRGGQRRVP